MPNCDVCKPGLYIALAATIIATAVGVVSLTTSSYNLHGFCLTCYGCALLLLSGSAVNFEPARLLK